MVEEELTAETTEETESEAPVFEVAPETPPEGEAEEPGAEEEREPEESEPIHPGSVKYTKAVQERVEKLAAARSAAERRAEEAEKRLAELEKASLQTGKPVMPKLESFQDEYGEPDNDAYAAAMEKYQDDYYDWRAKEASVREMETRATEAQATALENFKQKAERMRETYKDFDEVIDRGVFTPEMRAAILKSDMGPEIAYLLGKNAKQNPDGNWTGEAIRIGTLDEDDMLREIGRLEARVSAGAGKNVSGAPAPLKPLSGTEPVKKDPTKMSAREYLDAKRAGLIK